MKKLMIAAAAVTLACGVRAASMSWSYTGVDTDEGANIYCVVLPVGATSGQITSMASIQAFLLENTTVGGAIEVEAGGPPFDRTYTAENSINQNPLLSRNKTAGTASSYYFVMIDADEKNFYTSDVFVGSNIYDTDQQEVKPGTTKLTTESWTSGPTAIGAVPEPTSGLLLLLGVAGLALRRRRA